MNKNDKLISDKLNKDLKINQSYLDTIYATFDKLPEKTKNSSQFVKYKFSIATACCLMILITGVVFAKDIKIFIKKQFENFNMGNGVTIAIDNGYIGKSNDELLEKNVQILENNKIIDNINMKYKTEEFLMTDSNLNISFNSSNFETYCEKNGIDYDLKENIFTNASTVREYYYSDETLGLDLVCNIASSKNYPNSRKLNIYFTKIKLIPEYPDKSESRQITLEGNFEIYETKLTNTGFEIGLTINNIKEPVYPNELLKRQEELRKSYTVEEINSR